MMRRGRRRAVFLDKDGTLVEDLPYNVDPARMRLAPGALQGCARLAARGFSLIIVSNQPGVALGLFAQEALAGVEAWLRGQLAGQDIPLEAFYYCPHHPRGIVPALRQACRCRKPEPGLLFQAAIDHDIDLKRSWFVGDILDDVEAGRRAGCRTVLIDNGNETQWRRGPLRTPDHRARDLEEAADMILAAEAFRSPARLAVRR